MGNFEIGHNPIRRLGKVQQATFSTCGQAQVFSIHDDAQRMSEQGLAANKLFGSVGQLGGEIYEYPNNPDSVYPFCDHATIDR
ncbi:hypothetical protein [Planotetraspora silvatica]|uniref:hypothetical protein n=1 Tax=Planotetraspora silvatica TaxID=234614 RepID=UPI00194FEC9E|nr:hypothetical protein [Planotetraspora silvatica]